MRVGVRECISERSLSEQVRGGLNEWVRGGISAVMSEGRVSGGCVSV